MQVQDNDNNSEMSQIRREKLLLNTDEQIQIRKYNHIMKYFHDPRQVPQPDPTYREVSQTLQALEKEFPSKKLVFGLRFLRQKLIGPQKQSFLKLQNENTSIINATVPANSTIPDETKQAVIQPLQYVVKKRPKKKFYMRAATREREFPTKQKQQRWRRQQIVAKAFCDRQHGVGYLEKEILESKINIYIDRTKYSALMNSVVTEAFRNLQHFVMNNCKVTVNTLNRYEMGSIFTLLINCRIQLTPENSYTFIKFIRMSYALGSVAITQEEAMKLYVSIQNSLRSKIGRWQLQKAQKKERQVYSRFIVKRSYNQPAFDKFFADKLKQRELIYQYLESQDYGTLKTHFQDKYPDQKSIFIYAPIKRKINSLFRLCLKRVIVLLNKYKKPIWVQLCKMDKQDTRILSLSADASPIRREMFEFFFNPKQNQTALQLCKIVEKINQYIQKKRNERFNLIIQRKEVIPTVANKVQRNIHIGKAKLKQGNMRYETDEIRLKAQQKHYQHFLNRQNGEVMHFYRKIDDQETNDITDSVHPEKQRNMKGEVKLESVEDQYFPDQTQAQLRKLNHTIYMDLNDYLKEYIDPEPIVNPLLQKKKQSEYEDQMAQWLQKLNIDFENL